VVSNWWVTETNAKLYYNAHMSQMTEMEKRGAEQMPEIWIRLLRLIHTAWEDPPPLQTDEIMAREEIGQISIIRVKHRFEAQLDLSKN
jgi:hypothetical protein